jgi:hypothetical protein
MVEASREVQEYTFSYDAVFEQRLRASRPFKAAAQERNIEDIRKRP